jgi:hypothetical protein
LGRFGEKWDVQRGEDTGLEAALGAVFGPPIYVWTKGTDEEDLGSVLEMLLETFANANCMFFLSDENSLC